MLSFNGSTILMTCPHAEKPVQALSLRHHAHLENVPSRLMVSTRQPVSASFSRCMMSQSTVWQTQSQI